MKYIDLKQAVVWLRSKFEAGRKAGRWNRVSDTSGLIAAAMRQGIRLDAEEAEMILGYLEGHDYCLMADGSGKTMRHDEQCEDDYREDEPYTIRDAIAFCQEMNDDLLRNGCFQGEPDEGHLSQLRKDGQVLDALMARSRSCTVSAEEER